jgi:hypothetical protein
MLDVTTVKSEIIAIGTGIRILSALLRGFV